MRETRRDLLVRTVVLAVTVLLLGGCGISIPTDPDGTLDRVRAEGVLRAGASPRTGWVAVDGGDPSGREPGLVVRFADDLGADLEWTVAGEEELVRMLEHGEIDIAVGGFTEDNAWVDEVGLTRAYVGKHVMMVPMGENALQSELELWLDDHGGGS